MEENQPDNLEIQGSESEGGVQALVHACQCHDGSFLYVGHFVGTCPFPECRKMKRMLAHTKSCKRTALWNRTLVRFWIPAKIPTEYDYLKP